MVDSASGIQDVNPETGHYRVLDASLFEQCMRILLEDDLVDHVLVSIIPHTVMLHTTSEEIEQHRENVANRIVRQSKASDKPVVVSINAGNAYTTLVNTLENGGVPTFPTAQRAMYCLNRLVSYSQG